MKLYKAGGINFNFSTKTSDFEGFDIRADFNNAGTYTMRIKARSNSHILDRLVLYKINSVTQSSAENLNRVTTKCNGANTGGGSGTGDDSGSSGGDTGSGSGDDSGSSGGDSGSGSGSGSGGSTGGTQAEITSIQLLNADTDVPIATLTNGITVNVPNLTTQKLGIIANVSPNSGINVSLSLSGPLNAATTESVAPFSLFGDIGTNITGKVLPAGTYSLTVSTNGNTQTVSFSIGNTSNVSKAMIYQNPVTDGNIRLLMPASQGAVKFRIIDASGTTLSRGKLQDSTRNRATETTVPFNGANSGLYWMIIDRAGEKPQSIPFLVKQL